MDNHQGFIFYIQMLLNVCPSTAHHSPVCQLGEEMDFRMQFPYFRLNAWIN